ncbi:DUF488 family protein [Bacteroides acidifaciens]|uniref:DUF488 family protein, N3 subclade n=1 Tax=Bacteroides acidifaciens TaxID=85831 RepID=UPI0025B445E1|nr:DUF488 family protein [Bacteroides acidifaciens]
MKIYTSYFANLKNIPDSIVPISICRRSPKGYGGTEYKLLAPSSALLSEWHKNHDEAEYRFRFAKQLTSLDASKIVDVLNFISGGLDIVLVCYEGPSKFCHRHLVAEWFNKHGYDVKEWEGT